MVLQVNKFKIGLGALLCLGIGVFAGSITGAMLKLFFTQKLIILPIIGILISCEIIYVFFKKTNVILNEIIPGILYYCDIYGASLEEKMVTINKFVHLFILCLVIGLGLISCAYFTTYTLKLFLMTGKMPLIIYVMGVVDIMIPSFIFGYQLPYIAERIQEILTGG